MIAKPNTTKSCRVTLH